MHSYGDVFYILDARESFVNRSFSKKSKFTR